MCLVPNKLILMKIDQFFIKISASCSKFRADFDFQCQINPNTPKAMKNKEKLIEKKRKNLKSAKNFKKPCFLFFRGL